jgi:hypothetical protein
MSLFAIFSTRKKKNPVTLRGRTADYPAPVNIAVTNFTEMNNIVTDLIRARLDDGAVNTF